MSGPVQEILDRIQRLPEPQQEELRLELARQEEAEWSDLARAARETARKRGIDDAAIARAVESLRYGGSNPTRK
jgi:hypothetical protein